MYMSDRLLVLLPSLLYLIAIPAMGGRVWHPSAPRVYAVLAAQCVALLGMRLVLSREMWSVWTPARVFGGMLLLDTVEYASHRTMHTSPRLYRAMHRTHHEPPHPEPICALLNSPAEAGCVGALVALSFGAVGLSWECFAMVTILATCKTVWDHSWHSVHHALHHRYPRCNYEQPFFDVWDRLLGTRAPPTAVAQKIKRQ